ncbi:hypothetical protein [uncultured Helicobacter sp.]|uniref:hypothetical protein n=1 Tax=uncultured Helicobacter sp. TaxID=175537 RepID=UPI00374FAB69
MDSDLDSIILLKNLLYARVSGAKGGFIPHERYTSFAITKLALDIESAPLLKRAYDALTPNNHRISPKIEVYARVSGAKGGFIPHERYTSFAITKLV